MLPLLFAPSPFSLYRELHVTAASPPFPRPLLALLDAGVMGFCIASSCSISSPSSICFSCFLTVASDPETLALLPAASAVAGHSAFRRPAHHRPLHPSTGPFLFAPTRSAAAILSVRDLTPDRPLKPHRETLGVRRPASRTTRARTRAAPRPWDRSSRRGWPGPATPSPPGPSLSSWSRVPCKYIADAEIYLLLANAAPCLLGIQRNQVVWRKFMGFDEHAACARSGLIAEAWTLEPEPEFRVLSLK